MKINVQLPNKENISLDYKKSLPALEIFNDVKEHYQFPVFLCKVDNAYRSLKHLVTHDSNIEFLDIRHQAAWLTYQNSLILLYLKATRDILGNDVNVSIENSLNKGLFTIFSKRTTREDIKRIETRMKELVALDLPIIKKHCTRKEVLETAISQGYFETTKLLGYLPNLKNVEVFSLDDISEIFYSEAVPSTGYLKLFELVPYRKNTAILRFPHPKNPTVIPKYLDQKLLYRAFKEADAWGNLMHVQYVSDLNKLIQTKKIEDLYLLQEALHEKRISNIADMITKSGKRIILICGPSSSGKTSFAKRLCIQLRVNGIEPLYMGTDDYFVEPGQQPFDEHGEPDYESIKAVDTKLFVSNMNDLLAGKEVDLPTFDFIKHSKRFGERKTKIRKNQIIVIEGIHALNKELTKGIEEDEKFKIYISPLTPISIDRLNRISTTDARLLRRMVRDYSHRGRSVEKTLKEWPKVRKGEETNIFPYCEEAEVFFNSNCIYELVVLKKYVEPLLKQVTRDKPEYAEAQRLISFLRFFAAPEDDNKIVNNSIIREFIGGSVIVH